VSGPAGVYTGLLSMHNFFNVYADTVFLREYLISLNTLQPWTILSMVAHSESVSAHDSFLLVSEVTFQAQQLIRAFPGNVHSISQNEGLAYVFIHI